MADYSSVQIRPPKNWQDFEKYSAVLFECILNDRGVQKNGRSGQPQHGVDIFGRQDGIGDKWIGIQCKGKDTFTGGVVTEKELRKEVEKARKFLPRISEFYLITTAPDDASIQEVARLITDERTAEREPLSVNVWGWGTIEEKISEHPRAIKAFSPDASPFTDEILSGQDKLISQSEDQTAMLEKIYQHMQTGNQLSNASDEISAVKEDLDQSIHFQIDQYRDLLNEDKPKTALQLLETLKDKIWESASNRVRFRLITNIASAKYNISKDNAEECSKLFLEAYTYQPKDPKALANVALAHLILNNNVEAIRAANDAIRQDETNTDAASYLIQANIDSTDLDDPFSLVPNSVVESLQVDNAALNYFRAKNDDRWIAHAEEAITRHPNDRHIKRFYAEAKLEQAISRGGIFNGEKVQGSIDRSELLHVSKLLQVEWDKQLESESSITDPALPYNLALTYKIIEESDKEKAVLVKAVELFPENADLSRLYANDLIASGNTSKAISILESFTESPEILLLLAEIQIDINPEKAQETLEKLTELPTTTEFQNIVGKGLLIDYILRHSDKTRDTRETIAKKEVENILSNHPDNPLAWIIKSQFCEFIGDQEGIQQSIDQAVTLVYRNSSFYERYMVASRLESLHEFSTAADLLDGFVDTTYDSPPLRTLFLCFLNADRRGEANKLLKCLPQYISDLTVFLNAAYNLHIRRGDFSSAESVATKIINKDPKQLSAHLKRIDLWLRKRNEKDIRIFLESDVEKLEGKPTDTMRLAQLLARYKHHERALRLAYKTNLENSKNADVQLAYMGILLSPNLIPDNLIDKNVVGLDTAFKIKNTQGETEKFIIEECDNLRISENHVPKDHYYASIAKGLKTGGSFEDKFGEHWTIIEVKHKYLALLHSKMNSFNRLYPNSDGLRRFTINDENTDNSLEPILSSVKSRHDYNIQVLDLYEKNEIPLEFFAELLGTDVIDAWSGISQMGRDFKVCHGNIPERNIAFKCINTNAARGCVLDALTLHIVHALDIADIVSGVCGSISTTESAYEVFRSRHEAIRAHNGHPYMTMYWKDGNYYRDEVTAERLDQLLKIHESMLDWIDSNVEILNAESNEPIPEEAIKIRDTISSSFLDLILAAKNSNYLLLCEEKTYREFAATQFNLNTSWLQPVLSVALKNKLISRKKYTNSITFLVEAMHRFTSIDSVDLVEAFQTSNANLEILANALFCYDAEIFSHQRILVKFLIDIWNRSDPTTIKEEAATSIVLRRLFFGKWRITSSAYTSMDVLPLLSPLKGNKDFIEYLASWMKGHFITD